MPTTLFSSSESGLKAIYPSQNCLVSLDTEDLRGAGNDGIDFPSDSPPILQKPRDIIGREKYQAPPPLIRSAQSPCFLCFAVQMDFESPPMFSRMRVLISRFRGHENHVRMLSVQGLVREVTLHLHVGESR